jgi:DNA-binding XRE family transcriptional regulator
MENITLTIDGREYVAIPRAEFERTQKKKAASSGNVDALAYSQKSLGAKLKAARVEAGLTQVQLAMALDLSQGMIAGAEAGSTNVAAKYVERVLKACGLPADWAPKKKR